ncbi:MAG: carbonic anhydrase [Tepidisphaeraceae bacterium]
MRNTYIAGWIVSGLVIGCTAHHAHDQKPAAALPDDALSRLTAGNQRFVDGRYANKHLAERRIETASGQHPFAIIVACSDSRVGPELIFDETIGDLFIIRIAGNTIDADALGSIEYAVEHLHVPLIAVVGHERCGAVEAAESGANLQGNLKSLIEKVQPGKDLPKDPAAALAQGVRNNAIHQANKITKDSAELRHAVESHEVRVVAGVYSLDTGRVTWILPAPNGAHP